MKASIYASYDDMHDLYRLADDLFVQLQERETSELSTPAALTMPPAGYHRLLIMPHTELH